MLPSRDRPLVVHLRAVIVLGATACLLWSMYEFQVLAAPVAWQLLFIGLGLAAVGQLGLRYPAPPPGPPPTPPTRRRRWLGIVIAIAGAALWGLATYRLFQAWAPNFDFAWIGWSSGVALLGIGLDLAWGVWPRRARPTYRWVIPLVIVALIAAAGIYRLGNIADFPGEAMITQIEDLQVGNFGLAYLGGYRLRWEYLSSTWLAALGLWLGGPTQLAERIPFAVVSTLKVLPLFIWIRLAVGTTGALVGSALLVCSFWDVVLSRIPNNHNALIVSVVFVLIAGAVRRGRPSGYAWLGFLAGYVLHEYIAYRPLALFALLGALLWSLRDRTASWGARVSRPLLTTALLACMATPLFHTRVPPAQWRLEYLDGWNRAKGNTSYYNDNNTWTTTYNERFERTKWAVGLFVFRGDHSPVRSIPSQPPMVDAATATLALLGIGGALIHCFDPVLGLTLFGFAVTFTGTLIMTGNFDVARVGGAVPYVYALAGFGAAGLAAALAQAWTWRRLGAAVGALLLAAAVLFSGYWNTRDLLEFWHSPAVRRAHRNNLAYLAVWMRYNVKPGERVLGIAPNYTNALEGHDGSWLRGGEVHGYVAFDVETALRSWLKEGGPVLLFIYDGRNTPALAAYLEWLLPDVHFTIDKDPLELEADVAYVRLPAPPADLAERLAEWNCRGAQADFVLLGPNKSTLWEAHKVVPYLSKSVWPGPMIEQLYRQAGQATGIHIEAHADFDVRTSGQYGFDVECYAGTAQLSVDGKRVPGSTARMPLIDGRHTLDIIADYGPMGIEPQMRLLWSGPDTGDRQELMPFYRIAPLNPACGTPAAPETPASAPPADAPAETGARSADMVEMQ